jgi:hypothetical protein
MQHHHPIGTKVITTRSNGSTGWTPEVQVSRRWGARGEVKATHDSHGFCYEVQHEDGVVSAYEHDEIEEAPEGDYTPEQRQQMLHDMDAISSRFYSGAFRAEVHSFIEFCGLMNEYIEVCRDAEKMGIPFYAASTHHGRSLPFQSHHVSYLAEKLNCIYGPGLLGSEELRKAFINRLFDGEYKLVPVERREEAEPYARLDSA